MPPADAVTREGGVAATPLQVNRDAPADQNEGQAVSMRHRIAIGPNRQASLQAKELQRGEPLQEHGDVASNHG